MTQFVYPTVISLSNTIFSVFAALPKVVTVAYSVNTLAKSSTSTSKIIPYNHALPLLALVSIGNATITEMTQFVYPIVICLSKAVTQIR
jgi:hypothetical protein